MSSISILEAMEHPRLFEPWFRGPSWNGWKAILRARAALPMTDEQIAFFRKVAERDPPKRPARRAAYICGRRSGKDSIASLQSAHAAAFFDGGDKLRRGERASVLALGPDRDTSRLVHGYIRSYFNEIPPLQAMVQRETADSFELSNGVDITIGTSNFRSVRGRAILDGVLDEAAFMRSEESAAPDLELWRALEPGTSTVDGWLTVISTPYRKSGLLWNLHRDYFGRDSDDVLVIRAPTELLNPTINTEIIQQARRDDPAAAASEWDAEWRNDISGFISFESIRACVVAGRRELPPTKDQVYFAACDPAGGSGNGDSFSMAISHRDYLSDAVVLDVIREWRPPFNPESVVHEAAMLLHQYRCTRIVGDRWASGWPTSRFAQYGITYTPATKTRSQVYLEWLPLIMAGGEKLELLGACYPRRPRSNAALAVRQILWTTLRAAVITMTFLIAWRSLALPPTATAAVKESP